KEIVLTGVNTGDFGIRNGKREEKFIDLIKELDHINGIDRIRISSIEPNLLNREIIEFVASSNKFAHHFHIPLQSGSNKILKAMQRRYLRELYVERVNLIRQTIPDCCIGVDVIVGFPGENGNDFLETYNFLNELDISYLHVFTYSERPDTLAINMEQVVSPQERSKRSKMLRSLSVKKRRFFYEKFVKKTMEVLFEKDVEGGKIHGFTDNYIRVAVDFFPDYINQLKDVKLTEVGANGIMKGEPVNKTISVA
ncbi:MAG: radical SAM protein, partial [Cyclobacteriaceae bacterium]|nr:radical SAM protein [Cyclobacteriaceae bacterium]